MAYDISEPYGPQVTGRLRIITWNVWGRYGPWEARERAIVSTLASHRPDLVVLVEAWRSADDDQARRLAAELGFGHHVFGCGSAAGDARSGLAVLSAWPIGRWAEHRHSWSNANPWAAPVLWPDRRIDYILSAYPRRGGAGHPTWCQTIGTEALNGVLPSDHYGLVADLRY